MVRLATKQRAATVIAGAVAIVFVALCTQAASATTTPSITVSPSPTPQGSTVTISGNVPISGDHSCPAADAVQLTSTAGLFPPDGFGPRSNRDANGNFTTLYATPSSTPVGSYSVGLRCGGATVGITATLQVTQPATTTTLFVASTVPRTTTPPPASGKTTSISPVVWIVLGLLGLLVLLVAAGAALFFSRR